MGKSYNAPKPPDPAKVAEAQTGINRDAALAQSTLNQYNEFTPYGSSVYTPSGETRNGIPVMNRNVTFSPENQRIFEGETGLTGDLYDLGRAYTGRISDALDEPFSYEGLPEAPTANEGARQQVIDALYGQQKSRLDPEFEQERTRLETQLANQGITRGSNAWNSELDRYGRTRNDAYSTALNAAIGMGGAEQSRLFGLQGSERERAIQERAYLRDRPINEITALTSGRGLTMPQFSATPTGGINPADYGGYAYNSYAGQLNAYNSAQQARASLISSLANLGGSAASFAAFSDKRLKENIHDTGISVDGIPVKTWDWKATGESDIGVVAQDVEKKRPDAVDRDHPSGYRRVHYDRLFGLGAA